MSQFIYLCQQKAKHDRNRNMMRRGQFSWLLPSAMDNEICMKWLGISYNIACKVVNKILYVHVSILMDEKVQRQVPVDLL